MLGEFSAGDSTWYLLGQDMIGQESDDAWSYFGYDGLGSTRFLTDATGGLTYSADYSPYGELIADAGTGASSLGFTGEQTDASGLTYLRARYLNTATGTFLSTDPVMGMVGSRAMQWNPYLYVGGNPVNYLDPGGKLFFLGVLAAAVIGGAIGGAIHEYGSQVLDNLDKGMSLGDALTKCIDLSEVLERAIEGGVLGGLLVTAAKGISVVGGALLRNAIKPALRFLARHTASKLAGAWHAIEYGWDKVGHHVRSGVDQVKQWLNGTPSLETSSIENIVPPSSLAEPPLLPAESMSTTRLNEVLSALGTDWANSALRQTYEAQVQSITEMGKVLLEQATTLGERWTVARNMYDLRREITILYKELTPLPLRDFIYNLNRGREGYDEFGLLWTRAIEKYRTPEALIEASGRFNTDVERFLSGFTDWFLNTGNTYVNYTLDPD